MFTGLIEACGIVSLHEKGEVAHRLAVQTSLDDIHPGDSVAIQGVCLTVLEHPSEAVVFDVSPETLARTALGLLHVGDSVNMERALKATSRLGGHYVTGHVDTSVRLLSCQKVGDYLEMMVDGFAQCDIIHLIPKGSITLDGVSLTINSVDEDRLSVLLVPHTLQHTTLSQRKVGDVMNVEFDYFSRLIAHQVKTALLRFGYDKSV